VSHAYLSKKKSNWQHRKSLVEYQYKKERIECTKLVKTL
jgi:hypothetical protein